MPDAIADARELITGRLRELETERTTLERALNSMGEGGGTRSAARKPRRKRVVRKARRRTQAPRGRRREQLLAAIKAKPGARPSELAAEIGIAPGQVSALLAKARAEKLLVKKGAGYALKR